MDLVLAVVADEQPLEVMEPGEGALDHPAGTAKSRAVCDLPAGDLRCDPPAAQLAPILVMVVAAVGGDTRGTTLRPADLAAHRRHRIDHRDELGYVVAVAARDRPRERDPGPVDEQMVLGAGSGSINRARARRGAPFFDCT